MSAIAQRSGAVAASWWSARPAMLLLAGGELLLAGLAAAPASTTLAVALGRRPALGTLAHGDWLNLLADVQVVVATAAQARSPGISGGSEVMAGLNGLLFSGLIALLAIGLHGLLYTFVSGAALERMARRPMGIWRAGAIWFWPMLRLGVLLAVVVVVLGGVAAIVLALAPGEEPLPVAIKLAAGVVWMGAIGSWFELARATMVVQSDRGAWRGIWRALRLLAARPWVVGGTWLALGIGNLGLDALLLGLTLATSAAAPGPAWIVTALTVGLGTGYKLFRLAVQRRLATAGGRVPSTRA